MPLRLIIKLKIKEMGELVSNLFCLDEKIDISERG